MKEIQDRAVLKIQDGKLADFKSIANSCISTVKEKDTGTLQYDWFLDEVNQICIVREKYVNSAAVLEHMGNLGELLDQLLATTGLELEVFGNPSEELVKATEGIDIKVYPYFGGL